MSFFERKTGGKRVYDGRIIKVDVDDIELPDGHKSMRECVRHMGGAAIFAVIDGKVLLVKQFRYAYGKEIYEIPAGKLEKGEDPLFTAKRELEEETGYVADIRHMLDIYPTPGYSDEVIHIYRAENCVFKKQKLDEGEFLKCELIPVPVVLKMISDGSINDAKTICAVQHYLINK